jgi:CBS domain-containing protein
VVVERTEVSLAFGRSAPLCHHVGMTEMPSIPSAGSIVIADLTGDAVVRVPSDATVADVATAIADNQVGAVVVGDDARPTGLVTERDVVKVVASGRDPAAVRAADVASTHLVWCEADETVDQAAIRMTDHSIRHLLVERDGGLAGIVSARDLLGVYATDADQV